MGADAKAASGTVHSVLYPTRPLPLCPYPYSFFFHPSTPFLSNPHYPSTTIIVITRKSLHPEKILNKLFNNDLRVQSLRRDTHIIRILSFPSTVLTPSPCLEQASRDFPDL